MTTSTQPVTTGGRSAPHAGAPRGGALRWWISDVLVLTQRSLARIVRDHRDTAERVLRARMLPSITERE